MTGCSVRKEEKPKGKKRKKIIDEDDPVSHFLCLYSNNNFNLVLILLKTARNKIFKIWLGHGYFKIILKYIFFQNIPRKRSLLKIMSLVYRRCFKIEFVKTYLARQCQVSYSMFLHKKLYLHTLFVLSIGPEEQARRTPLLSRFKVHPLVICPTKIKVLKGHSFVRMYILTN